MNSIYAINHFKIIDNIVIKKRTEILKVVNNYTNKFTFNSALDIGSTNDSNNESSNFIIKNLKNIEIFRSISDQKINLDFFQKTLTKSITDEFTENEIKDFSSDIVISNATIEHVGNYNNQIKMIKNIIKLSKKLFIITTPNRFHPIDFHTKIPLIHWLPKKLHRKILNMLGLDYFAKEENLNLLSKNDLKNMLNQFQNISYEILHIDLLKIKSNYIIIGEIKNRI